MSLIGPVLIVSVVIISCYFTSKTIGYGRNSCYLDSAFLIGISTVAPVCLVSLCNFTFLARTVFSIHRVYKHKILNSIKTDQYKNLILYVKLSSVTGAFWVVTILAEALDSDAIR
ncbi:adhesion G protein-coupled receptor E4P [Biomphalaria glabrata]|nr:adhesion G protein-coupled receptor E4P [Biomphalaria glabrata]